METLDYIFLLVGGLIAGVINTLAGNGSAITLPLLIFMGLPADVANATNRIGALTQTSAAVLSLRRTPRTKMLLRSSVWFILPAILGSFVGAYLAIDINPEVLRTIIGVIMLVLLITLIAKPQKWKQNTDLSYSHKTPLVWIMVFIISVYGGFLQMGIGIMLLSLMVLLAKKSLRDGNIIKLVLALTLVAPAFVVFVISGQVEWKPGLTLAVGQTIGAIVGARYILFLPKANTIVRWLLIVILSISSISLLRVPEWIAQLL